MKRTLKRSGILAAAGSLVLAGLVAPSAASAAPKSGSAPVVHQMSAKGVAKYWTPKRMRAATPIDRLLPKSTKHTMKKVEAGKPRTVRPTKGLGLPDLLASTGDPWTGGGDVVKTAGRVFFTYDDNGTPRDASCSGDAVTSANKSTVLTAGHCVKLDGNFHTNWT